MKQSWRQASMQVFNSSVARPWKLEQNTSGQASTQASSQASRASRPWKLEQNNMTKKGPFFGPQNLRKSRRAKMGLPSMSLSSISKHPTAGTLSWRFIRLASGKIPKVNMLSRHCIIRLLVAGLCPHFLVSWSVRCIAWFVFVGGITRIAPELENTTGC